MTDERPWAPSPSPWRCALVVVLLVSCGDDDAPPSAPRCDDGSAPSATFDPFAWLADPSSPARRLPGEARLASSREIEDPSGFGNGDWGNFLAREGNRAVIVDAPGPGVMTRLWLTIRDTATQDLGASDGVRIHVEVDGNAISFVDGEQGITLGELASGVVPGFTYPFVASRVQASGAWVVTVPVAFASRLRISVEDRPTLTVYWLADWLALPCGTTVRPFDGRLDATELDALDRAAATWASPTDRGGVAEVRARGTASPDGAVEVSLDEPSLLRRVRVEADRAALAALVGRLEIDGDVVVDDVPLARWLGATSPAAAYSAAYAWVDDDAAALDLPAPVRERATFAVRAAPGTPAVEVGIVLGYDEGAPDDDLGRLAIQCADVLAEPSSNVTLVDVSGPGQMVGLFVVARGPMWGWTFLEGDHEVFVDGEPTLLGTGTEDYFGGAFYFWEGPFAIPWNGAPGVDLMGFPHLGANLIDVAMYRHHVLDAVPFETSLRFELEAFTPSTRYESCAYLYR
ncbi:MAG: DUF2961 domain-containing protein [Deltaproteobacteria bacterium]|nr:DUF2961 domain-containing protein [Deltaproteobacteria bacterium]